MQKVFYLLIISIVLVINAKGQSITPTTYATCGASLDTSGVSLDFTIGNTTIETINQNNIELYQGFHFPDCAPKGIGQINGCEFLCAEDTFTVYQYTFTGVLNMEKALWSFLPTNAIQVDTIGSDFVKFKIIDNTVSQIMINVTPQNICGNGVSISDSIMLDTDCVVPGDVDGSGIVNDDDIYSLLRAKRLFHRNDIWQYGKIRNLPCLETNIINKYDFALHPALDWDSSGYVYKFPTIGGLQSFKHADVNGNKNLTVGSGASDFVITLDSDGLYSHFGKVTASLFTESSNPGLHYDVVDTVTTDGDIYVVEVFLGDSSNTFNADIITFGLGFEEGLHNNPSVNYKNTHFGPDSTIYYADYIDRNPDDTTYAYIALGSRNDNSSILFSGDHVCGVICEISPTLISEDSTLLHGSIPYKFFIGDMTVYDSLGNKTIVFGHSITIFVEPVSKPKYISVTSISSHQNDVKWYAHLANPEYFLVERYLYDTTNLDRIDTIWSNTFQNIDTLNNGMFLYSDTNNIIPDELYFYRIKSANDTIGSSSWSEWTEVTSGPAAPDSLVLQSFLSTSIDFTWKDNSPYADSTFVEVDTGNGVFVAVGASSMESWIHNGLQPFSPYCYRIRTKNEYGVFSDYYNTQCCTTMPAVPNTPNNVIATPVGNTAIVTWAIDTNSITDKVYINRLKFSSTSPPQGFNDTIAAVNITQYIDTTVEQGYMYCYRLYTENASGSSFYSDTVCVLLCDLPVLTATANEDTITLNWTDNCLAESDYIIRTIDELTGDTTIAVFPYNTTNHEYILPSGIDTFNYCYQPAFHVVNGLYYSDYGNAECVDGFIGEPISTRQVLEENNNFKVFPNPTSNVLNIESLDNTAPLESLELLGLNGQVIFEYAVHHQYQMSLDLSDLPNAVYILRVNRLNNYRIVKTE